MKEIKPLTSLRAFAAFLVFMFHYAHVYRPENLGLASGGEWIPLMPLWRQGQVGVSIFFVLSGFLITRIYYDAIQLRQVSWRLFFVKRFARIWPLFLLFAVIQHLVPWIQGAITPGADWLVTLSMSQGFFFDLRYEGLPTAWSLTVEESFYALTPLVVLVLVRCVPEAPAPGGRRLDLRRLVRYAAVLAALTLVLALVGEGLVRGVRLAGWDWQGFMGNRFHLHHATVFGRFPEFAIGILAAMIHRGVDLERWLAGPRATVVVIAAALLIAACIWGKDAVSLPGEVPARWLVLLLAYGVAGGTAVLILGLSASGGWLHRALAHPLLVYLGRISYGFYLIQITVLLAPAVALSHQLGAWRVPALLVMTNLICAVFYQLVEVPARRAIVRRWGGA